MNRKSLLLTSGKTFLAALLCFGGLGTAKAQVLLSGSYSEDFNTLLKSGSGSFTDNSTLTGWYVKHNTTGAGNTTAISADNGSDQTSGIRSYGLTTSDAERALGGVRAVVSGTTQNTYYGLRLKNNTGGNINSFTIKYSAEEWRRVNGNKNLTFQFAYSTSQASFTDLTHNSFGALAAGDLTWGSNPQGSGGASDGNTVKNTHTFVLNLGSPLAPNQEIMLRWTDISSNQANCILALDDINVTPSVSTIAPVYYSKASATDLTATGSWGTSSDGNGTRPSDFNSGMFVVANKTAATITTNWALSASAKVLIAEGTFTLPANAAINNATVDVADNATLKIEGSVPVLGSMGNNSTVIFNGAGVQDVPGKTYGNLTISGSGTKLLNGKTTVNGTLNFLNSDLQADATDTLFLGTNATVNETTGFYFKGKLLKPVTINGTGQRTFGGMGLSFDNTGGGNWGLVKVTRTTDAAIINPKDNTKESIMRSWHIVPEIQAGTDVSMTFKWLATEDNGQNFPTTGQAQVQAWKSTDKGLTWKPVGSVISFDASGAERTVGLTTNSFSIWTFSGPGNPLPVSWLSFKGKATSNGNELNWATASEKNAAAFVVERSADGKNFETIGSVKAAGNSNQILAYNFTDKQPLATATAYYRLKQTDNDGAFEYSSIIAIAKNDRFAKLVNAYPNPFGQTLNLQLAPNHTTKKVVLLSLEGKEVYSRNLTSASETQLNDLPNLKAGVYFLQLIGDTETTTLKVMRQ
ncbi:T9SS type A sorting domain-containing protein [Adhaeribacter terreus]|uniref:T9SS type A sorting domain-containing protein n=1 Tax=Adhaeribacter terreus TaxID=529703 RepID=A0ABW0EDE4_9BACT